MTLADSADTHNHSSCPAARPRHAFGQGRASRKARSRRRGKRWRICTTTLKALRRASVRCQDLRKVLHAWLASCIMQLARSNALFSSWCNWLGLLHCFPLSSCSSRSRFFFSPSPFHADLHVPPLLSYRLIWFLLRGTCVCFGKHHASLR